MIAISWAYTSRRSWMFGAIWLKSSEVPGDSVKMSDISPVMADSPMETTAMATAHQAAMGPWSRHQSDHGPQPAARYLRGWGCTHWECRSRLTITMGRAMRTSTRANTSSGAHRSPSCS